MAAKPRRRFAARQRFFSDEKILCAVKKSSSFFMRDGMWDAIVLF